MQQDAPAQPAGRTRSGLPDPWPLVPYPTAILALSVLLGLWAAYDRGAAWPRALLILAGLVLMLAVAWAGRQGGRHILGNLGLLLALLTGAVGVYYLLAADWTAGEGTFPVLQQLGLTLQTWRPAIPLPEDINDNMAGNVLVTIGPLGMAGLLWARRRGARLSVALAAGALLVGLIALLLSQSRGAWLALAGGMVAAGYLALRAHLWPRVGLRLLLDLLAALGLLAVLAGFWITVASPGAASGLGSVSAGDSAISRATLWQDGLALVQDYPFTGSGLGSTMMVYSTYGRLLHVGFITHMHNLYLQIAVEQGLLGLVGLLGLLILAAWNLLRTARPPRPPLIFCLPAAVSLAALILHGLVDAGAYSGLPALVAFLPIGFALGIRRRAGSRKREFLRPHNVALAFVLVVAIISATLMLMASGRAALQANLAAVAQSRAELSVYQWPQWPIQDELRRSQAVDLDPAIARYQAALALNPNNAAANRRLGQIELSLGQYRQAWRHLAFAHVTAPGQRATRQLLGEAYAVTGDPTRAAELWRSIALNEGQIDARIWWYEHIGEPENARRMREAAELAK